MINERPTHFLNVVTGEGKAARFTEVAALCPTKDGNGFTGEVAPGITISGRLVILKRKEREPGAEG
jgi:hypothetical protein